MHTIKNYYHNDAEYQAEKIDFFRLRQIWRD